jgi:ABC-type sulfate transport system permease component
MNWRNLPARLMGSTAGGGLTQSRIRAAYAVAIATDVLQLALGPFGWAFADQILDVIATIATTWLLGFHPLLLPTFVLELVPIVDMLPTWTACVALVVAMRKKQPPPIAGGDEPVTIDVTPTSVT